MKHLGALLAKWTHLLLLFLKPFGVWGAGAVALLDSSTIPVPMDLIIATYVWNDRPRAWLYVLMGAVGSVVGGLLPFLLGRAGGELFLLKRIDRARYEKMRDHFERGEFLALMVPSMLPPPTPWKLFVFAAGVFEMRLGIYALAVFAGRCVRFGVLGVLTVHYGPEAASILTRLVRTHGLLLLVALGVVLGVWAVLRLFARRGAAGANAAALAREGEFEN